MENQQFPQKGYTNISGRIKNLMASSINTYVEKVKCIENEEPPYIVEV